MRHHHRFEEHPQFVPTTMTWAAFLMALRRMPRLRGKLSPTSRVTTLSKTRTTHSQRGTIKEDILKQEIPTKLPEDAVTGESEIDVS